jgi:mRNA interferase RelE/StbE
MSQLATALSEQLQDSPQTISAGQMFLTRTAHRSQRKLDKPLREKIKTSLLCIAKSPEQAGEKLSMPLEGMYSHHVKYKGKEFRIAYTIQPDTQSIVIILIGAHENFYKKLKGLKDSV